MRPLIVQAMFTEYRPTHGYDEYFCREQSAPRAELEPLLTSLGAMGLAELNRSHASASNLLRRLGATFRLNDQDCMVVSGSCPSIHCRDSFTVRNGLFWSAVWCNVLRLLISFWRTFMGPNGSSTMA